MGVTPRPSWLSPETRLGAVSLESGATYELSYAPSSEGGTWTLAGPEPGRSAVIGRSWGAVVMNQGAGRVVENGHSSRRFAGFSIIAGVVTGLGPDELAPPVSRRTWTIQCTEPGGVFCVGARVYQDSEKQGTWATDVERLRQIGLNGGVDPFLHLFRAHASSVQPFAHVKKADGIQLVVLPCERDDATANLGSMVWQPLIEYGTAPRGLFLLLRGWARFQINIATHAEPHLMDVDAVCAPMMVGEIERPLADPTRLQRDDPRKTAKAGATVLIAPCHAKSAGVPLLLMPYPTLLQLRSDYPEVDELLTAHMRRQAVAWHPWIGGSRKKEWRVAKWLLDDVVARGLSRVAIPRDVLGYKMRATVTPQLGKRGCGVRKRANTHANAAAEIRKVLEGMHRDDILTLATTEKGQSNSGYYEFNIVLHERAEAKLTEILGAGRGADGKPLTKSDRTN